MCWWGVDLLASCQLLGGRRLLDAWLLLVAPQITNHTLDNVIAYGYMVRCISNCSFYIPPCVLLFWWDICCKLSLCSFRVETETVGDVQSVWPAKSQQCSLQPAVNINLFCLLNKFLAAFPIQGYSFFTFSVLLFATMKFAPYNQCNNAKMIQEALYILVTPHLVVVVGMAGH